jgi:dTDP-4-amino-4,6-dideoxygalactose transaminase
MHTKIPFNKPYMTGKELHYISQAHLNGALAGDGNFTKLCHKWLTEYSCNHKTLLTHSCTAALEMSAILLNIKPGDEIIMPSYTFVSTANAFVLRGGIPVFIDIREDTLNINENLIEFAITKKTKAIVPVHYAGISCEMDSILEIAKIYNLNVIEDAAQGLMSKYKDKPLGTLGDIGAYSFHETKNIISGEGGAIILSNPNLSQNAEIIREKGTDRSRYFRGEIDKYTWQEIGSSFLPGEIIAAFLWAQLEDSKRITEERLKIWNYYHELLESLETRGVLKRPYIPIDCSPNGHLYYIVLDKSLERDVIIQKLNSYNINVVFHYVPLHLSPAGKKYGKQGSSLTNTEYISTQLIRLPIWIGLQKEHQERIVECLDSILQHV